MSDNSPANVFHRRSRHNPPHRDTHRHTLNFSKLTGTLCPTLYPDSAAARLRAAGGVTPERGSDEQDGAGGAVTRATDLTDALNVAKTTDWRKIWRRRIPWTCVVKSHDSHSNVTVVKTYLLFVYTARALTTAGNKHGVRRLYPPPPLRTRHVPLTGCDVTEFLLFLVLKKKRIYLSIYLFIDPNIPPKNIIQDK